MSQNSLRPNSTLLCLPFAYSPYANYEWVESEKTNANDIIKNWLWSAIWVGNTVFEIPQKCRIFKNSPKLTISGILNELMSTQNVNRARFALNVECDFF